MGSQTSTAVWPGVSLMPVRLMLLDAPQDGGGAFACLLQPGEFVGWGLEQLIGFLEHEREPRRDIAEALEVQIERRSASRRMLFEIAEDGGFACAARAEEGDVVASQCPDKLLAKFSARKVVIAGSWRTDFEF